MEQTIRPDWPTFEMWQRNRQIKKTVKTISVNLVFNFGELKKAIKEATVSMKRLSDLFTNTYSGED